MKSYSFILFFSVVLIVYTLAHYYLYVRALQAFSPQLTVKRWGTVFYVVLASSFMIGMFMERMFPSVFNEILQNRHLLVSFSVVFCYKLGID